MSLEPSPSDTIDVICPYCGESVELFLEADIRGEMVQDCEVCCHPWRVRVMSGDDGTQVVVDRLDD